MCNRLEIPVMALGDIKHSKRKRFGNGGEEGR